MRTKGLPNETVIHEMTSSMEEVENPPTDKCPRSSAVLVDRISNLPDSVINHIFSFLPTLDVVATSILSTRWKYLWTKLTTLNFIFKEEEYKCPPQEGDEHAWLPPVAVAERKVRSFVQFVNKVSLHIDSQRLQKFLLKLNYGFHLPSEYAYVTIWASYAITRRVRVLVMDFGYSENYESPLPFHLPGTLFTCATLEVLEINCHFVFKVPSVVCLPKLEVLSLCNLSYESNECIPRLLRGCPMLHSLKIETQSTDSMRDFRVLSPSLRRVEIFGIEDDRDCVGKLEIDAPNLEYFDLDERFEEYFVKRPNSVTFVALDLTINNGEEVRMDLCNSIVKLVEAMNQVKFLTVKLSTLCALSHATTPLASCFERLTKLDVHVICCEWSYLGVFLGRSTKLQVLNITKIIGCFESNHRSYWCDPTKVPKCLSSSLEKVSFVGFKGLEDEMMVMIKYILQHGEVLESFTLKSAVVSDDYKYKYQLLQHISTFPRFSRSCQIHFS